MSLACLLFFCVALATHFGWMIAPLHSDVDLWIRVARDWRDGATLYRETYDNKLPTVYLLARLLDCSNPALTWYLAEVIYTTAAAAALFAAMRRTAPLAAIAAPLLIIVWTGTMPTGQGAEAIALALDVIAISFCALAAQTGKWWLVLLAGAFAALIVSFRPPTLLNFIAYTPTLWLLCRRRGLRVAASAAGAFIIGGTIIVIAIVGHAMVTGYWTPLMGVLRRDLHYASISRVPLGHLFHLVANRCTTLLTTSYGAPLLAAFTIVSAALRWRHPARISGWRLWFIISGLWLFTALASTLPGGRDFVHYYHVIWAPLAVLATLWLDILCGRRAFRIVALPLATALISFTVSAGVLSLTRAAVRQARAGLAPGSKRIVLAVAAELNRLIPSDEIAPICVWSYWSELHWRVRRRSVSPALVPIVFLDIAPDMFDQWTAAMLERPPAMVVFDEWGLGPTSRRRYLYAGRPRVKELEAMLREDYVEIRRWNDLYVLARRGSGYDAD
jgi:hypothetical protein